MSKERDSHHSSLITHHSPLIVLAGPTGTGKSDLALRLALAAVPRDVRLAELGHRPRAASADAGRDSPTTVSADPDPRAGYEAFLADIVAVAQRFGFEPEASPGRDEPRLRGLRQ